MLVVRQFSSRFWWGSQGPHTAAYPMAYVSLVANREICIVIFVSGLGHSQMDNICSTAGTYIRNIPAFLLKNITSLFCHTLRHPLTTAGIFEVKGYL